MNFWTRVLIVWSWFDQVQATYREVLIFEDTFDTFDLETWEHELSLGGNGNREFEVYVNSRNNSFVKNGKLHLKPTLTQDRLGMDEMQHGKMDLWGTKPTDTCTNPQFSGCVKQATDQNILPPVQSARIRTAKSFSFMFGRIEIDAKLPSGKWLWPAMWLMPLTEQYGPWPNSGEIDLMESRGNGPDYIFRGKPYGNDVFSTCFHFGPTYLTDGYEEAVNESKPLPSNESYSDSFHTFGLYWTDTELYSYADDPLNKVTMVHSYAKKSFWNIGLDGKHWTAEEVNPYKNAEVQAPFDQEFFLIFNLAVGGTSFSKSLNQGFFPDSFNGKPWKNSETFPQKSFLDSKDTWYPSWLKGGATVSDDAALQVDRVRVWGFQGLSTWSTGNNPKFTPNGELEMSSWKFR